MKWPALYHILNSCLGLGNVHIQKVSKKNRAHCTGVEKGRGKGYCLAESFVYFLEQQPKAKRRCADSSCKHVSL